MAKKLVINCGSCDTRNVSEETLAAYECIVINCGGVFVSPESRVLLNRYGVSMNCGNVKELDKDVVISKVNGSVQIKSSDVVAEKCYLMVNGKLDIGPGTGEVLERYVGIFVNGSVTYPESVSAYLSKMKVNGSTTCYPDDAIVLKRNAVIDKLFALRAKRSLYWSAKRMIMVDPQLDGKKLEERGASFSAKEVIIAESKVEDMIGLIDEQAEIIIVPDGAAVLLDDVELGDVTIKKHGTKLYILGDLEVSDDSAEALEQLTYLNIRGDAKVPAELKAKLMEAITEISGDVEVLKKPRGRRIEDKMSVRISKWMLEQEAEGISVSDCMKVILDEDIPCELILEKLEISDCMEVKCTTEQEAAVAMIAEDVMQIGSQGDQGEDDQSGGMDIGDVIKGALGGVKELLDTKVINAGDYVL